MLGSEFIRLMGSVAVGGGGGGSGSPIVLTDAFVDGTTYAQWTLGSDGFTYLQDTSGAATKGPAWISPQLGMNLYEVKATVLDGNIPPGTIGSWINAGSGQTWGWIGQNTAKSCDLTIQIRQVSDGVVVGTATIGLTVDGIL